MSTANAQNWRSSADYQIGGETDRVVPEKFCDLLNSTVLDSVSPLPREERFVCQFSASC